MPFDALNPPILSLTETVIADLRASFEGFGHQPAPLQWEAIRDLLDHLMQAADGTLPPAVYLSTLPAGTGKSTTLQGFAGGLCNRPEYAHVGMLIACHRIEEVRAMAEALKGHRKSLCVIIGKGAANEEVIALGGQKSANDAQIVLTTQAFLTRALQGQKSFEEAHQYHYQGQKRAVVCWDEAFAFNHPVVIDGDAISSLTTAIRKQSDAAATALKRWVVAMDDALKEPALVTVPDFEELGLDFSRLEEEVSETADLPQAIALRALSGGKGWLIPGTFGAAALVTHYREIPHSIMPIFVTDASGAPEVHGCAYDQIGNELNVVKLKSFDKNYSNLSIVIVPIASSRDTYFNLNTTKGKDRIELAVKYIKQFPIHEAVLVVSYKAGKRIKNVLENSIAEAIDARLTPAEKSRTRHVTWGSHTATNEHQSVRRVLLTGLNFPPRTASYAASGAALNKSMKAPGDADQPTKAQVAEMLDGIIRSATFQAILRGHARQSVGGDCGVMEVIIFQTLGHLGTPIADYEAMFCGASVREDISLLPQKALSNRMRQIAAIITRRLQSGETEMLNKSISDELNTTRQAYAKVTDKPEWEEWLTQKGLSKALLKGKQLGLRLTV